MIRVPYMSVHSRTGTDPTVTPQASRAGSRLPPMATSDHPPFEFVPMGGHWVASRPTYPGGGMTSGTLEARFPPTGFLRLRVFARTTDLSIANPPGRTTGTVAGEPASSRPPITIRDGLQPDHAAVECLLNALGPSGNGTRRKAHRLPNRSARGRRPAPWGLGPNHLTILHNCHAFGAWLEISLS